MSIEPYYTLAEAAVVMKRSTKWVRNKIREGERGEGPEVEHIRMGRQIQFSPTQLEKFREQQTLVKAADAERSVTTGRKRKAS